MSMSVSGITLSFAKGWSLALAMLAIVPMIFTGMIVFTNILNKQALLGIKAYAQSGGYAEQAL